MIIDAPFLRVHLKRWSRTAKMVCVASRSSSFTGDLGSELGSVLRLRSGEQESPLCGVH